MQSIMGTLQFYHWRYVSIINIEHSLTTQTMLRYICSARWRSKLWLESSLIDDLNLNFSAYVDVNCYISKPLAHSNLWAGLSCVDSCGLIGLKIWWSWAFLTATCISILMQYFALCSHFGNKTLNINRVTCTFTHASGVSVIKLLERREATSPLWQQDWRWQRVLPTAWHNMTLPQKIHRFDHWKMRYCIFW